MAHKRAQIRQAIAVILREIPSMATRVRTTQVHPTSDAKLPRLIVYALQEQSALTNLGRKMDRTAAVVVEIRAKAVDDMDDVLDDLCEKVENAMESDYRFGGLAVNSWLASTTIGIDGEGQERQGVASLEYRVSYRTEPGAAGS